MLEALAHPALRASAPELVQGLRETVLALGADGMAARRWLREGGMPRSEAAELVTSLAWRGISSFPLSHPPSA